MNKQNKFGTGSRVFVYCIMILILLSLLVTATYTWFSISQTPRVSNIGMNINAPTGLVLSGSITNPNWVRRLDYVELVPETAPLRPVTWSDEQQRFLAAHYGADGRLTGQWTPLSDEINANRDDVYGYYIKVTFYATTDTAVDISLTPAVEVEEGVDGSGTYLIGSPVWNSENILHDDGGAGAEKAIRIGFRFTPIVDDQEVTDHSSFIIYEPNCDSHLDGTEGYVYTPSIDGTESLVPDDRLILQTTTSWTEADIVQRDVVIKSMGEFTTDTDLYSLKANDVVRIDMYIWLEGQDVDCTNKIGHKAQLLANVQFDADIGSQSGMETIPED